MIHKGECTKVLPFIILRVGIAPITYFLRDLVQFCLVQFGAILTSKYCDLSQDTDVYRNKLRFGNAYKIGATGENAYRIEDIKIMQEMGFEPTYNSL